MTNLTPVDPHGGVRRPSCIGRDRLAALPAAALALLLLLVTAGLVVAVGPKLTSSVTDQAEVLTQGEEASIAEVLGGIRDSDGIQLFVAFVDTTGSDNVTDYATALAEDNSLGGNDALLLVAIEDRSDALWIGDSLDAVTDDEIDAILVDALEPGLADGDFAGAVIAAAHALADAASVPITTPQATAAPDDSGSGSTDGSDGIGLTLFLVVLVVGVGGFLVIRAVLRRRAGTATAAAEGDQLNRDANRLLLETDEALKDAANDVEFAAAQWGDAEVVPYREAIELAGDELRAAFTIRQRLDDAQPETAAERDAMLREIVARTTAANQALDAQEQRFDQLQDLERTAPEQLTAVGIAIDALRARCTAAAGSLDRLTAAYALSATGSVAGNLPEADKALDAASAETERGQAIVETRRTEAVVALRHAQDGLAGATHLVEAVERLAVELDGAAAKLPEELAAATADVEAARSAIQHTAPEASIAQAAGALEAAEQALDEARRAAAARPLDPLAALQRATAANQGADAIVGGIRAAEAAASRRAELASTAITSARGHVTRTVDFITTRRHAVGHQARTRAAEAETQLDMASSLIRTDPKQATEAAERATQLADEAYRLATAEFETMNVGQDHRGQAPGGGFGGWGGTPWGGSGGGSRSGGGFGGFGGGGRSSGSGPSGGRSGGGSFGSSGGSSGSSGGGGGRVRGGRW